MASPNYVAQWAEVVAKDVDAQTKQFLRQFVLDFQGKFEEVLDICTEFKKYQPEAQRGTPLRELPEFECHLFLEKRDEALTVKALRENLKAEIRLDPHHNVAIMEYLLFRYKKKLAQLFAPPPPGGVPAHLLAALDRAIDAYNAVAEAERARLEELAQVEADAANAARGLDKFQANKKKEQLQGQEFGSAFAKLQARKAKREAEEALANAPKIDPYEEEQKRLAAEKAKQEEEDRRQKEESRNRLKSRAALWQ